MISSRSHFGAKKPGFSPKYLVQILNIAKKPGFFSPQASVMSLRELMSAIAPKFDISFNQNPYLTSHSQFPNLKSKNGKSKIV
jgi:hypothetical protein